MAGAYGRHWGGKLQCKGVVCAFRVEGYWWERMEGRVSPLVEMSEHPRRWGRVSPCPGEGGVVFTGGETADQENELAYTDNCLTVR